MKHRKTKYYLKTIRIPKLKICTNFGIVFNNLHSGHQGFSLFIGDLFVWHQAWFGGWTNEVTWWNGKFLIMFPFLGFKYSPTAGFQKF